MNAPKIGPHLQAYASKPDMWTTVEQTGAALHGLSEAGHHGDVYLRDACALLQRVVNHVNEVGDDGKGQPWAFTSDDPVDVETQELFGKLLATVEERLGTLAVEA